MLFSFFYPWAGKPSSCTQGRPLGRPTATGLVRWQVSPTEVAKNCQFEMTSNSKFRGLIYFTRSTCLLWPLFDLPRVQWKVEIRYFNFENSTEAPNSAQFAGCYLKFLRIVNESKDTDMFHDRRLCFHFGKRMKKGCAGSSRVKGWNSHRTKKCLSSNWSQLPGHFGMLNFTTSDFRPCTILEKDAAPRKAALKRHVDLVK